MSKAKVLIVEDEIITAAALRNALQEMGFSVCSLATSGEKAIKTAEHELPDIVLMNIKLSGGMDGFEAAREIHSHFGIPIIYMTGYPVSVLEGKAGIRVQPYEYLAKPVESLDMKKKIDSTLQKHKEDLAKKKDI
jgi:CheY-like chemotaxis protein